jgi:hypothetical protein
VKDRLTNSQIVVMRSLIERGAGVRPITLDHDWQRQVLLPLWRRGLIEIYYRQSPREVSAPRGPFYLLTASGERLASRFVHPAPRGFSGAEQTNHEQPS